MQRLAKSELKGFLFAGIAAIALANSFIFSKLSFAELDFFEFGFWWFLLGTAWNLIYLIIFKRYQLVWHNFHQLITGPLIVVTLLEAVATGLFYYAILVMENPGVVSFIGNIGPVFVSVLGYLILKESFNRTQLLGIIVAVGGIFTLNYHGYTAISEILIPGSQYVILASLLFAIAAIVARRHYRIIDAGILSLVRAIIMLVGFFILISIFSKFSTFSLKTLGFLSIGSFLEVFITIIFAYMSFKYIKAFKTSITISTKGIFALISAWIFLNLKPEMKDLIGGVLSIIGVMLISRETKKSEEA